jgi:hypothetical protein
MTSECCTRSAAISALYIFIVVPVDLLGLLDLGEYDLIGSVFNKTRFPTSEEPVGEIHPHKSFYFVFRPARHHLTDREDWK